MSDIGFSQYIYIFYWQMLYSKQSLEMLIFSVIWFICGQLTKVTCNLGFALSHLLIATYLIMALVYTPSQLLQYNYQIFSRPRMRVGEMHPQF